MTNPPSPHPPVLVVDTDAAHTELVRQSLTTARLLNPVLDCFDADVALAYLRGLGEYADRDAYPVPSVVVVSFDLPHQGGQPVQRCDRRADGHDVAFTRSPGAPGVTRAFRAR